MSARSGWISSNGAAQPRKASAQLRWLGRHGVDRSRAAAFLPSPFSLSYFLFLKTGLRPVLKLFVLRPPLRIGSTMYEVDLKGFKTPLFHTLRMPLQVDTLVSCQKCQPGSSIALFLSKCDAKPSPRSKFDDIWDTDQHLLKMMPQPRRSQFSFL